MLDSALYTLQEVFNWFGEVWPTILTGLIGISLVVGIVAKRQQANQARAKGEREEKRDKREDAKETRLAAIAQGESRAAKAAAIPRWKYRNGKLNGDHWYLVIENTGGAVAEVGVEGRDGRATIVELPHGVLKLTFPGEEDPGEFGLSYVDKLGDEWREQIRFVRPNQLKTLRRVQVAGE